MIRPPARVIFATITAFLATPMLAKHIFLGKSCVNRLRTTLSSEWSVRSAFTARTCLSNRLWCIPNRLTRRVWLLSRNAVSWTRLPCLSRCLIKALTKRLVVNSFVMVNIDKIVSIVKKCSCCRLCNNVC